MLSQDNSKNVSFGNSCNDNMQFTLQWSGSSPAAQKTYRIGGREDRSIAKLDSTATLTGEARATFGLGKTGKVNIEERPNPEPTIVNLIVVNLHDTYTLVEAKLRFYPLKANTHPPYTLHTATVVVGFGPTNGAVVGTFDKADFSHWEIESIRAEDDPA
jgi:hypothetical protein